jgi:4-hydroxybenzoate polyprenyltransferase
VAGGAKSLYGFSRGTQAMLSIAQPVIPALFAVDGLSLGRFTLLIVAAAAGYGAVLAAHDLMDLRLDRRRLAHASPSEGFDLENAGGRHPVAGGHLRVGIAVAWVALLTAVAVAFTAMLSWVCFLLFIVAALLQVGYCALATVTPYKFVLTGIMVACGAFVGWFAMTSHTDWLLLGIVFAWMFAWEIGGRNVVNDWADVAEDTRLGIKTAPVVFGFQASALLVLGCALLASLAGIGLMLVTWPFGGLVGVIGAVVAGWFALVRPSWKLLRDQRPPAALAMFNRASFYPAVMLVVILLGLGTRRLLGT